MHPVANCRENGNARKIFLKFKSEELDSLRGGPICDRIGVIDRGTSFSYCDLQLWARLSPTYKINSGCGMAFLAAAEAALKQ